jgi:hypothetical protein
MITFTPPYFGFWTWAAAKGNWKDCPGFTQSRLCNSPLMTACDRKTNLSLDCCSC